MEDFPGQKPDPNLLSPGVVDLIAEGWGEQVMNEVFDGKVLPNRILVLLEYPQVFLRHFCLQSELIIFFLFSNVLQVHPHIGESVSVGRAFHNLANTRGSHQEVRERGNVEQVDESYCQHKQSGY